MGHFFPLKPPSRSTSPPYGVNNIIKENQLSSTENDVNNKISEEQDRIVRENKAAKLEFAVLLFMNTLVCFARRSTNRMSHFIYSSKEETEYGTGTIDKSHNDRVKYLKHGLEHSNATKITLNKRQRVSRLS